MRLRQSMLLILGVSSVTLPFGLPACDQKPDDPAPVQQAKAEPVKPAPAPADPVKKPEPVQEKKEPAKTGDFRLPDDDGGKLVSRIIPPRDRPLIRESMQPRPRPAPRHIDNPSLPLPPQVASLPRLPDPAPSRPIQPQLLSPEPVLGLEMLGGLPQPLVLPALERVRLASPDVDQPVPLPRLAVPLSDRASLTDPTGEASRSTALSATLPVRATPAPFQQFTLPDPFENHDTVKLRTELGEESLPDTGTRLPRR